LSGQDIEAFGDERVFEAAQQGRLVLDY